MSSKRVFLDHLPIVKKLAVARVDFNSVTQIHHSRARTFVCQFMMSLRQWPQIGCSGQKINGSVAVVANVLEV